MGSFVEKGEDNPRGREKVELSYLSAAVDSISPWSSSRSSTPKPLAASSCESSGLKNQHGGYHHSHWHGLSLKRYPKDCPPLNVRWFYAVDVPKRKSALLKTPEEDNKPLPLPKKFITFSHHDSRAIELEYQELAEQYDDPDTENKRNANRNSAGSQKENTSSRKEDGGVRVPVHEDFLFDVDIERRELSPVYWLGPIYEVRRGSWFYQEGSTLRACEENLASQLEEGFLKVRPFRYPKAPETSTTKASSKSEDPKSLALSGVFRKTPSGSAEVTPKGSHENLKVANQQALEDAAKDSHPQPHEPQTHRLFGTYMNSIVTYQDSTIAWLSSDNLMSRVSNTMYSRFAGGGYLSGIKLVRGYTEPGKQKETAAEKIPSSPSSASRTPGEMSDALRPDEKQQRLLKRRSAPPSTETTCSVSKIQHDAADTAMESLEAEIGLEMTAESARKRDEKDIQNDYYDRENENQGREIEHLILVTHGIGQRLGMRTESVNFIHDVNVLRQNLKNVYSTSADLQALNSEVDKLPKNCRVQVLPVCWRHLLDFPKKGVRQNRKEHDLGDAFGDEEEYPSLQDITIEGIPFVRSLITDLALDILLYQSAYREHISGIVLAESNRLYDLFRKRNPEFKGKVSLIGHSLGSAILFDILCRQSEHPSSDTTKSRRHHSKSSTSAESKHHGNSLEFHFEVEDFYCLGSPIGLFQMLKGRNILARHDHEDALPAESPMDPDYMKDPFLNTSHASGFVSGENVSTVTGLPLTISSPKVAQLYNIFHPSDPISYRLEPLVAPAMSSMKPQPLPYTKKTLSSSVSGIGAKVGQSVSGFWSSLSSGIASSLLNRSLGLTSEDISRMESPTPPKIGSQSVGAGTNVSAGVISDVPTPSLKRENTNEKQRQLAENTAFISENVKAPTLIDDDLETLYAGFQKRRQNHQSESSIPEKDFLEAEERGKKLRREEAKVRALNQNGRIDYSIQESVLDFNPINTIASHLSYWADEDVSHFMMSQLLSRHRRAEGKMKGKSRKDEI